MTLLNQLVVEIAQTAPNFVSIHNAIEILATALKSTIELDTEDTDLMSAVGRILCKDVYTRRNRPPLDISAVDGFAIRSSETTSASTYNPAEFRVRGVLRPGDNPQLVCLEPGTTVRVQTGAPIPCGADAVVMDEDVEVRGDTILVRRSVPRGYNVIFKGEDLSEGDIVGASGTIVSPSMIAALAASGIGKICTYRKIRVSVIAVGSELVEPWTRFEPGKEFNSTSHLIFSQLLKDWLFEPTYLGIVPDEPTALEEVILKAVDKGSDLVITTGATGVSEADVVSRVMTKHRVLFRGVKMRPGRTTSCSIIRGKVVIHLSGFPVAAWTGYELLLRSAIQRWLGLKGFERPFVYALLTRKLPGTVGYTSLVRVKLIAHEGEYYAEPYMIRGSGVISSLLKTNGYVVLPEDVEGYDRGEKVRVYIHTYW